MKKLLLSALALCLLFTGPAYASGAAAPVEGGSQFIELDPLILPIIDGNGVSQTISLVIALEVNDPAVLAEIEHMTPKLKDAYIQDMYGMLSQHAAMKGGVLQVSMLKKRLNRISTEVMGEDKIQDVLLQVVQQRPI